MLTLFLHSEFIISVSNRVMYRDVCNCGTNTMKRSQPYNNVCATSTPKYYILSINVSCINCLVGVLLFEKKNCLQQKLC